MARHRWRAVAALAATAGLLPLAVACGPATGGAPSSASGSGGSSSSSASGGGGTASSGTAGATSIPVPVWRHPAVSPQAIPLGDGKVSTSPRVGYVDSCTTSFRGGGARHSGPWLDAAAGTWNAATKLAVRGHVLWPNASNSFTVQGNTRVVTTNDLPKGYPTGTFPIASTDPAHQYDTNPNSVQAQSVTYDLPLAPTAAKSPGCLGLGPIGVMTDGVLLFDALDAAGRDAGAHELQDSCGGHPQGGGVYHYHTVSPCLLAKATGPSTLVGYALDGYGIYVERDAKGNLPTDADLDACHGRTSVVMWNGRPTNIYHYDATTEYPYTIGCFHGTSVAGRGSLRGGGGAGGAPAPAPGAPRPRVPLGAGPVIPPRAGPPPPAPGSA